MSRLPAIRRLVAGTYWSWFGLGAAVCGIGATIILSYIMSARERSEFNRTTELAAYNIKGKISSGIQLRVLPLERLASHWAEDEPSRKEWDAEALVFHQALAGYESIRWLEASYEARWAVPLDHHPGNFASEEPVRRCLDRARSARATAVTGIVTLPEAGKVMLVATPIFRHDRVAGFILGILHATELFHTIISDSVPQGLSVAIRDNQGDQVYRTPGSHAANLADVAVLPIDSYDIPWAVQVWPTAGYPHTFSWTMFVLGLLVSSLLYVSAALAQTERSRSHAMALANAALEKQIGEREDWEEALRLVNESLEAVIQASPLAIVYLDLQGNIKRWNTSAERMFGWKEGEVIEKTLPAVSGDPADGFDELVARTLAGETLEGFECRRLRKDRRPVDVAIWTAACRDGSATHGVIVTLAEITERKRLEDQLRHAQKLEAVGRLAGGVAHDFNNLLTIINGYSHVILDLPQLDRAVRGQVEEVLKAGNRAATLTTQLLAFSRRQMIQPRALNLNHLVTNVERMLQRVIGEHIRCQVTLGPDLGLVKADPTQIEQILINLAVNARDAMPDGGVLHIETANAELSEAQARELGLPAGEYVCVSVQDSGRGMDAETQTHLFEPFFTTKDRGKGTGLGLSSVYGSVKQNNGGIQVASEPGKGTTFSIYLPKLDHRGEAPEDTGDGAPPRGSETILVVEDEAALRRMIRDVLVAAGYRVLEAGDGQEALDRWHSQASGIDLLLTDVIMPLLNGHELAQRLTAKNPRLKVIYISGHTDDVIAYHGVVGSKTILLQKPFRPVVLAAKVRETLDLDRLTYHRAAS